MVSAKAAGGRSVPATPATSRPRRRDAIGPPCSPTSISAATAKTKTRILLNYGYAVLRAIIARAICAAGFHPSLGIHHHNRYNAFCLADDLMEPFRPDRRPRRGRIHAHA